MAEQWESDAIMIAERLARAGSSEKMLNAGLRDAVKLLSILADEGWTDRWDNQDAARRVRAFLKGTADRAGTLWEINARIELMGCPLSSEEGFQRGFEDARRTALKIIRATERGLSDKP